MKLREITKKLNWLILDIVHKRNIQLSEAFQRWKARIFERGDTIKDETDLYAFFTEQGTSASDIIQAKLSRYGSPSPML